MAVTSPDLRHHGDLDAEPGLLDFAVNVRGDQPPGWLRDRLVAAMDRLGRYPSAGDDLAARRAVADRHRRSPDEVLVLAGAAEGFALLPALRPRLAAVVHPGFTEPEVALRTAGVPVHRVLTTEADGHRLRPDAVPPEADLVVLGNPTNPTSVLHPAEVVRTLARPGRVLVLDEAFADAVPGETASLASADAPGLLVLRSLTKTWALAGLRAGYALGAPSLLTRLATGRPPWPVGTLTLEAVLACCQPEAVAEAEIAATELVAHRKWLVEELSGLPGVAVQQPAAGPFLLLRVPRGPQVRAALRAEGIAVRRCDTFPGLTEDHLRVAVRPPARATALVAALAQALADTAPGPEPDAAPGPEPDAAPEGVADAVDVPAVRPDARAGAGYGAGVGQEAGS
ncbi:MAG TPA: Rv2231c family pyridoxal phosphate-dependent protein CobC [Pseudonocardia sp.]|nr:Rv2231c family pyridoxal phosphate-dependent protein CobC [Pseudonocardia sp.]HTF54359.1 Rv2231c family pyridoxal phosphate-dependent protein CobC [Pseudonocardia sp.]